MTTPTPFHRREIPLFLTLTFALSAVFYFLIIKKGSLEVNNGLYVFLLMWCPGTAALMTRWITHRSLQGLGWRPGPGRYLLLAYLLPVVYAGVVYGIVWLSGLGAFDPSMLDNLSTIGGREMGPALGIPLFILAGTFFGCLSALGEEIGWRGFLVPALYDRFTFSQTSLLSGLIWAVWHAPLILFADYYSGAPRLYALGCFIVLVLGISFAFAWLRLKSSSLWPAVLLHASHNLFIQGFFDPVTEDTGITEYITTEFGVGLALAGLVVALFFYQRRDDVYRDPEAMPHPGGTEEQRNR